MGNKDLELVKKYGIKVLHVAELMGITESLLRYHLAHELKHPETCEKFRDALLEISDGIRLDLADYIRRLPLRKATAKKARVTARKKAAVS